MSVYLHHFGLKERPFDTAPDPKYAYASRAHEMALLRISDSVESRLGICLLKGQIGTGKSTVASLLMASWLSQPDRFVPAYIPDPSPYTPAQFLRPILAALGLEPSRYIMRNRELLRAFLLDRHAENKAVVVMMDEAQSISPPNMATLLSLSNEQTPKAKLIQIVLLAQPQVDRKLLYAPALNSRIARRGNLDPLVFDDTVAMMAHRLSVAGGDFNRLFPEDVRKPIYDASEGIPRRVCIICDNALLNSFGRRSKTVDMESVCEAIRDNITEPGGSR